MPLILPILLLVIAFILKLFIDRVVDAPAAIQAICELPVDILFLSLSFTVAFTISNKENQYQGILYCFSGLLIAIFVVFIWRKSIVLFLRDSNWWMFLLFINLSLSFSGLMASINFIIHDVQNTEQVEEGKEVNDDN